MTSSLIQLSYLIRILLLLATTVAYALLNLVALKDEYEIVDKESEYVKVNSMKVHTKESIFSNSFYGFHAIFSVGKLSRVSFF